MYSLYSLRHLLGVTKRGAYGPVPSAKSSILVRNHNHFHGVFIVSILTLSIQLYIIYIRNALIAFVSKFRLSLQL